MPKAQRTSTVLLVLLTVLFLVAGVIPGVAATAEQAVSDAGQPQTEEITAPTAVTWQQWSDEGYRQLAAGEVDKAQAAFAEALKMNPRGTAAKTGQGIILARQGKVQEAEELLREALVLNPDPTRAHYELGRIYQQQGDFRKAITEFKLGAEKYRENHP